MISLEEARAIVLGDLTPTGAETIALTKGLGDTLGRTLAASVIAARTQPPTRTSAMDGYAVRAEDLSDAPAQLTLIGESAAGHAFAGTIGPGQAARVSTGATAPDGATQVVMREDCELDGDRLTLDARPKPGAHIRLAGVDFSQGDELLTAGRRLNPFACSLAASSGQTEISVHARPRVGVLSTGDELVEPGAPFGDENIINSNAAGVLGAIAEAGGAPVYLGIVGDTPEDVRNAFANAKNLDLLITIGGASVGDHDHLRAVFADDGGTLMFEKIAIKPGKPTWYGRLNGVPVLGLAGNPVSAMVLVRLLLTPAVRRLCGDTSGGLVMQRAELAAPLTANGPREMFIRAQYADDGRRVQPLSNQDSSALSSMAASDVLIRRAPDAQAAAVGDVVEIVAL